MRFVGLALHDPAPYAKTIWLFREQLARAGAAERLFARSDALLRAKGWLAMGGQIPGSSPGTSATVIEARRPRLTKAEKDSIADRSRRALDIEARAQARDPGRSSSRPQAPAGDRGADVGYKNHVGVVHNFTRLAWLQGRTAPA
jgi:transposase, IS5 family